MTSFFPRKPYGRFDDGAVLSVPPGWVLAAYAAIVYYYIRNPLTEHESMMKRSRGNSNDCQAVLLSRQHYRQHWDV
jgi:hypothetical protein